MNNIIWLIVDSCRWDTYVSAYTPNIDRYIGPAQRRYTYDGWTYPAHMNFLLGLVPHQNMQHCFASKQYQQDFEAWKNRIGIDEFDYAKFLPEFSLIKVLQHYRYYPTGIVSLPCLNKTTLVGQQFGGSFIEMDDHNDIDGIIDIMLSKMTDPIRKFFEPNFFFVNIGNTHYPYMLEESQIVHGIRGALKNLANDRPSRVDWKYGSGRKFADFKNAQVEAMSYVDLQLARLFEAVPDNTYFIFCADHGELFGEGGFFGHGPIFHELLFQIPYVEGMVKRC